MLPPINLVASPVWPLVNGPPQPVTVAAVFPRAAYLTNSHHWFSLVVPGAALPPDGIRIVDTIDLRALLGQVNHIRIGNRALLLPDGRQLSISPRCRCWQPQPRLGHCCSRELRAVACRIAEELQSTPPQEDPSVKLTLHSTLPLFDELLRNAANNCQEDIMLGARHLAGRGPGLTPLGDDLLIGCCLALTILARRAPQQHDWLTLRQLLAETAAPATTARSAAWLRQAGKGEFAHELTALARALCTANLRWVVRLLRRILTIGSSSGWANAYGVSRALCLLLSLEDAPICPPGQTD